MALVIATLTEHQNLTPPKVSRGGEKHIFLSRTMFAFREKSNFQILVLLAPPLGRPEVLKPMCYTVKDEQLVACIGDRSEFLMANRLLPIGLMKE